MGKFVDVYLKIILHGQIWFKFNNLCLAQLLQNKKYKSIPLRMNNRVMQSMARRITRSGISTVMKAPALIYRPICPTIPALAQTTTSVIRRYSSEPVEAAVNANSDDAATVEKKADESDDTVPGLEAKTREIIELKDRYLRSVADYRNLQERTKRDMQAARDFAIQKFAKDLIDSVDNLDRALAMVPPEKLAAQDQTDAFKDLVALHDGLKMTETILMGTLKKHGLERFDPSQEHEKFNPNEHEATFMVPMKDMEDNTVFQTQQKGFKLNGRILRAAKVGVVKNS
ncbi:BgTH12-02800 [Blumeria graminis f. sp. triticale]|nr:BgTH12-02800 [Blumeria graminis f. sp. triticale]